MSQEIYGEKVVERVETFVRDVRTKMSINNEDPFETVVKRILRVLKDGEEEMIYYIRHECFDQDQDDIESIGSCDTNFDRIGNIQSAVTDAVGLTSEEFPRTQEMEDWYFDAQLTLLCGDCSHYDAIVQDAREEKKSMNQDLDM